MKESFEKIIAMLSMVETIVIWALLILTRWDMLEESFWNS